MAVETITIQPGPGQGKEGVVNSTAPNAANGSPDWLTVGRHTSAGTQRAFLQFGGLPDLTGRVLTAATLELRAYDGTNGTTINIHRVTRDWEPATTTWNAQPTYDAGAVASVSLVANGVNVWSSAAFLALVQSWIDGSYPNRGVAIDAPNLSTVLASFRSSRYTIDPTHRPKLTITSRLAATATPTSPAGTSGSPAEISTAVPRLNWTYSSPDGGGQQRYQVRIFDAQNSLIYESSETSTANKYHDVPASAQLQYGQIYHWQVRVYDGAWGPWSTTDAYFRPTLSAPTNLEATPSAENATIALEWEGNEAATGYHVYRKNAASGDYRRINLAMLTAPEYVDSAAACGVIYDYAVVAVASNGYESPLSDPVQASVIFTGTFIDDLRLEHEPTVFHPEIPFVGSSTPVLGRREPTVFRRQSSRTLRLEGICTSRAELQAIVSRLAAPGNHRYVDAMGEVMRFEVTSAISFPQHRPYDPQNPVYFWSVTVTEVA